MHENPLAFVKMQTGELTRTQCVLALWTTRQHAKNHTHTMLSDALALEAEVQIFRRTDCTV